MRTLITIGLLVFMCNGVLAAPVQVREGNFIDPEREREIPWRLFYPEPLAGPHPVVIFSHGLGGSVDAANYLGKHLAAHGYLVFHIQHPGSDASLMRDAERGMARIQALQDSLKDPQNAINRFQDIPFVVDSIEDLNVTDPDLRTQIDTGAIGIAGHSYGARSTLAAAGELLGPAALSAREPRIRAGLALSPNLSKQANSGADVYRDIAIPLFHITGTRDGGVLGAQRDMDPAVRTQPWERIDFSPQYLLVLDGARHMSFGGGQRFASLDPDRARYHAAVTRGALAFFNAFLLDDAQAKVWLEKEFARTLAAEDRFEYK